MNKLIGCRNRVTRKKTALFLFLSAQKTKETKEPLRDIVVVDSSPTTLLLNMGAFALQRNDGHIYIE